MYSQLNTAITTTTPTMIADEAQHNQSPEALACHFDPATTHRTAKAPLRKMRHLRYKIHAAIANRKRTTMSTNEEKIERKAVETMITAKAIADEVFGTRTTTDAVLDVYDWLIVAPSVEELSADLKRIYSHAAAVFKTPTPTPDQVFGLFERVFENE